MIGFILTGHGDFSLGVKSAVDMVAGDQPAFKAVPFEGSQAATYGEDLRAAITEMREECEGVLVFCDLLGGTPFNQSMLISQDVDNVEVVAGTNLPMLIELVMTRRGDGRAGGNRWPGWRLPQEARAGGRRRRRRDVGCTARPSGGSAM